MFLSCVITSARIYSTELQKTFKDTHTFSSLGHVPFMTTSTEPTSIEVAGSWNPSLRTNIINQTTRQTGKKTTRQTGKKTTRQTGKKTDESTDIKGRGKERLLGSVGGGGGGGGIGRQ